MVEKTDGFVHTGLSRVVPLTVAGLTLEYAVVAQQPDRVQRCVCRAARRVSLAAAVWGDVMSLLDGVGSDGGSDRPLVITADAELLDDVLRLAAAAGVEPEVVPDAAGARRLWRDRPLIVVGADAADEVGRAGLGRRPGVLMVTGQAVDDTTLRTGLGLGAAAVFSLPAEEAQVVAHLADTAESGGRRGLVVCIVGARGGAGASTLAAALAVTAARRRQQVVLVDADPLGGGIELVLGGEGERGLRWSGLRSTRGRTSGLALRAALPTCLGVQVVSWDRTADLEVAPAAMRSVVEAASRVSDLVVADIPRFIDERSAEVLMRSAATFLLVPAEVRAAAAASRVLSSVSAYATNISAVVRVPGPSGLGSSTVADSLGIPLFGELRPERGVGQSLEHGAPPARSGRGPLARLCGRILDDLVGGTQSGGRGADITGVAGGRSAARDRRDTGLGRAARLNRHPDRWPS